jgi:hypothetical protein
MTEAEVLALGAPRLPAGHYYHIAYDTYGRVIQIRRERRDRKWYQFHDYVIVVQRWIGNVDRQDIDSIDDPEEAAKYLIKVAATSCVNTMNEATRDQQIEAYLSAYVGDHF